MKTATKKTTAPATKSAQVQEWGPSFWLTGAKGTEKYGRMTLAPSAKYAWGKIEANIQNIQHTVSITENAKGLLLSFSGTNFAFVNTKITAKRFTALMAASNIVFDKIVEADFAEWDDEGASEEDRVAAEG